MRRFYLVDTVEYLIKMQWRRNHCNANNLLKIFKQNVPLYSSIMVRQLDKQDRQ